jgi:hypothetical protein
VSNDAEVSYMVHKKAPADSSNLIIKCLTPSGRGRAAAHAHGPEQ